MSHQIVYTILNTVVVATILGGTDRSLRTQVAEHIPKWLVEAMNASEFPENMKDRRPASSIARHLIECGHKVEFNTALSLLHKIVRANYFVL